MSGPAAAAPPTAGLGLGLDAGSCHKRAAQRASELVQTYLHHPPEAEAEAEAAAAAGEGGSSGEKAPLRLPSLVATARRTRGSMTRLSKPSLLTLDESVQFEGFSSVRRPSVFQKRPPRPFSKSSSLLPGRILHPAGSIHTLQQRNPLEIWSCGRPSYVHFSHAIQPGSRSRPARRHSHNPIPGDLRPPVMQQRDPSSQKEPLSVVGRLCLPSCSRRPAPASAAAAGPSRTQLHVFLPTEAEGEEADSESVDEGFMDELDSKITSLKLQQGAVKAVTYH